MKEKAFINIIKNTLNSEYIGDDCAYLKDFGVVVTQDSLVEGVHFSMKFTTPYKLGYKSVMVNISDVCASGAEPKYITIALSLPDSIEEDFIKEFYEGAKAACGNVKIVGGDITGADKIYVSVTAIGSDNGRKISSRSSAKVGQKVVVSGYHGSSALGLKLLADGNSEENEFIKSHLMPEAQIKFSTSIALNIKEDYAMMDTSDGLMDALSSIAYDSGVMLEVDFDKIPHDKKIENYPDWKDLILFGGEDYGLIATLPEAFDGHIIGEVKSGSGIKVNYKNSSVLYTKEEVEKKLFKHFRE